MKPGGTIDRVFSKIIDTPLYWPVKTVRSLLDRLTEAREEWTGRLVSLRLRQFMGRCSVWMIRLCTTVGEPGVKRLWEKVADPDVPEQERRMALYSAVMATLRAVSTARRYQFHWTNRSRRNDQENVVPLAFAAAGIHRAGLDNRTAQWALSHWGQGKGPEIMIHPKTIGAGILNLGLFHELFHMTSPLGGGFCLNGNAMEILANRFAVEMAHPLPGLIHYAETDAKALINRTLDCTEVMRTTSRRMFHISVPATGDASKGSIVVQAGERFPKWWDWGGNGDPPAWDDLAFWSKPGLVDFRPPNIYPAPAHTLTGPGGFLNLQTKDGLYYAMPMHPKIWPLLAETGILSPEEFAGMALGNRIDQVGVKDIQGIEMDGSTIISGGRYFILYMRRRGILFPSHLSLESYEVLAIEDEDDYLYHAWEKALSGQRFRSGPLLPPGNPQRHEHLVPFNNWWSADQEGREKAFDYWAEMVTDKFMRGLTAQDEDERQTHEAMLILAMLSNKGIMQQPAFGAQSVQDKLFEYGQRHGTFDPLSEPLHLWAGELADHPVMKEAQSRLDQIRADFGSRSGRA